MPVEVDRLQEIAVVDAFATAATLMAPRCLADFHAGHPHPTTTCGGEGRISFKEKDEVIVTDSLS